MKNLQKSRKSVLSFQVKLFWWSKKQQSMNDDASYLRLGCFKVEVSFIVVAYFGIVYIGIIVPHFHIGSNIQQTLH